MRCIWILVSLYYIANIGMIKFSYESDRMTVWNARLHLVCHDLQEQTEYERIEINDECNSIFPNNVPLILHTNKRACFEDRRSNHNALTPIAVMWCPVRGFLPCPRAPFRNKGRVCRYRDSHYKEKAVTRPSTFSKKTSKTGKMTLYWNRSQVMLGKICPTEGKRPILRIYHTWMVILLKTINISSMKLLMGYKTARPNWVAMSRQIYMSTK